MELMEYEWDQDKADPNLQKHIAIPKNNREKEKGLVATGILPVILNRQAGSLSHRSALRSDQYRLWASNFWDACWSWFTPGAGSVFASFPLGRQLGVSGTSTKEQAHEKRI
jgi:hypothetical protein